MNPKFSIVITVTREKYVTYALKSALKQNFSSKSFEIIFSDNSDKGLKKIFNKFKTKNLKYFRPKKYLSVHHHWDFAFSKAKGDWVLLLCDDDILDLGCLDCLNKNIKKYPNLECFFWYYGYFKKEKIKGNIKTTFSLPEVNNKSEIINSSSILNKIFQAGNGIATEHKLNIPFLFRTVYSRKLLERIRKFFGHYVIGPEPMAGSGQLCLALTDNIVKINKVLTIIETSVEDSASNHIQKPATYRKMMSGIKLKHVPIKSIELFPSTASDTLLKVQKILKLNQYTFNFIKYFAISYFQILEFKTNKELFDETKKLYNEALLELNLFSKVLVKYEIIKKIISPYIDVLLIKSGLKKSKSWRKYSFGDLKIEHYNLNKDKFRNI